MKDMKNFSGTKKQYLEIYGMKRLECFNKDEYELAEFILEDDKNMTYLDYIGKQALKFWFQHNPTRTLNDLLAFKGYRHGNKKTRIH